MRKFVTWIVAMAFPVAIFAQTEPEYRMEIGAGAGMMNYMGDFQSSLFGSYQPWLALTAKYRLNPRMGVALNIGTGKVKGSSDDVETWYPIERYEFDNRLTEAALRYEYNFWPYGTGKEYRGARRLTPFVTGGLALTHHGGEESGVALGLPIGAGIKYKLGQRLNLTAEWVMRFTTSDYLDGRGDVYGIQSSGLFKNTDCYSAFQLSLTYDLWVKCKTCNNDR